jgi:hypothetical protein
VASADDKGVMTGVGSAERICGVAGGDCWRRRRAPAGSARRKIAADPRATTKARRTCSRLNIRPFSLAQGGVLRDLATDCRGVLWVVVELSVTRICVRDSSALDAMAVCFSDDVGSPTLDDMLVCDVVERNPTVRAGARHRPEQQCPIRRRPADVFSVAFWRRTDARYTLFCVPSVASSIWQKRNVKITPSTLAPYCRRPCPREGAARIWPMMLGVDSHATSDGDPGQFDWLSVLVPCDSHDEEPRRTVLDSSAGAPIPAAGGRPEWT